MENSAPTGEPSKWVQDLANLLASRTTEAAWTPFTPSGALRRHPEGQAEVRAAYREKTSVARKINSESVLPRVRKMVLCEQILERVSVPSTEAPGP